MKTMSKRTISLLLAMAMLVGTIPQTVLAVKRTAAATVPQAQPSAVWPHMNTDLTHIICYGQSFSVGADAPYYADPPVDGVYVYGNITDSTNGTALNALTDSTKNQHPIISAGNVLAKLLADAGIDTDIILGSYGSGGRTIAQLMSAERQSEIKKEDGYSYDILSSGRYEIFQSSVSALAHHAQKNQQSISCPAIVYLQGETDQNTDAQLGYPENPARAGYGAGGDKEKYKEYMSRLKEDMQREIMAQYGQTEKPLFVIYQVSGTYTRTDYSSINMAQLEFAQENEDVILVQTPYFTSHYTNSHHLTQNGYRWLGEYIGRSIYTALVERKKTWPLLPTNITVEDRNVIRIRISNAQNGLSIDTHTVEDASNSRNLYGFSLEVDGVHIKPENVTVSGTEILVTIPQGVDLYNAEKVYLLYAGRRASGTGNIRDNCTALGFYDYLDDSNDTGTGNNQGVSFSALDTNGNSIVGQKYPLYNWLASFCYEVEVPEGTPRQAAQYHWDMQEDGLVSIADGKAVENALTLLQGSVENGVLMKAHYSMEKPIVLQHDLPWAIEWKAAGNGNSYPGGKILSASQDSASDVQYLYQPADARGMIAWGVSSKSGNFGFKLSTLGIDIRKEHIYRIENRIATDGVNTVYLMVDGVEIGAMTTGYRTSSNSSGSAGSMIEEPINWANGKNIYLGYLGEPTNFLLNNMKLSYLKVWECGDAHIHTYKSKITAPTCTEQGYTTYTCACGDSYVDDYVNAAHNWSKWEQLTAPTCAAEGQDRRICVSCSDTQYRDTRISGDPNKILVSTPVAEDFFDGKILMSIGDSLTAGTLTTKEERYHYLTAQALGMTNINSGTSGATLCPGGYLPNKFDTLMTSELLTVRNVDVVTIFLGVNDWNNGVLNGTYRGSLKYDPADTWYDLGEFGTDDTTTIYGAAKMWCERILELQATEACKDIQFVFMTPVILSRNRSVSTGDNWNQDKTNVFGYTLREYCTAIMEVCAYYGVPVLDLNMYSGMYYHSEVNNNVEEFGGDGIHPGPKGHAMMAAALTEFLQEGYTYETQAVANDGHSYANGTCGTCYLPCHHQNGYTSTVTTPTCTEQGYTAHTCACGDSYVDSYVPATGHKFSVYTADGNATYEANGTKTALCDHGCGTKDTVADVGSMLFPEQVTSSIYTISDGILGNVPAGTTVSALLSGLDWGKYCTVFDTNGNAVDASAKVATGMVVKLLRGAEVKQILTIAVRGDTNGDGTITLTDFVQIKAHLLQKQTLTGAAVKAADYSADGSVTVTDFMQVKALLLQTTA